MQTPALVMIDFETSGISPDEGGRVTEVAAIRIRDGVILERFVSLINCNVRISSFITQLTGITQNMVDRAPPVGEVLPKLIDFIGEDYLAAHNASFDEKFLIAEAHRLGLQTRHCGVICSVKLARRVLPGHTTYSLGPLAARLGLKFNGQAHRAEADADVAARLILRLMEQLNTVHPTLSLDFALLEKLTRQSAAKVPSFLAKLTQVAPPPERKKVRGSSKNIVRYRHYKGGIYELVCEATQESDLSPVIVYRAANGSIWTRPKAVFFEWLEINGTTVQRFSEIIE